MKNDPRFWNVLIELNGKRKDLIAFAKDSQGSGDYEFEILTNEGKRLLAGDVLLNDNNNYNDFVDANLDNLEDKTSLEVWINVDANAITPSTIPFKKQYSVVGDDFDIPETFLSTEALEYIAQTYKCWGVKAYIQPSSIMDKNPCRGIVEILHDKSHAVITNTEVDGGDLTEQTFINKICRQDNERAIQSSIDDFFKSKGYPINKIPTVKQFYLEAGRLSKDNGRFNFEDFTELCENFGLEGYFGDTEDLEDDYWAWEFSALFNALEKEISEKKYEKTKIKR